MVGRVNQMRVEASGLECDVQIVFEDRLESPLWCYMLLQRELEPGPVEQALFYVEDEDSAPVNVTVGDALDVKLSMTFVNEYIQVEGQEPSIYQPIAQSPTSVVVGRVTDLGGTEYITCDIGGCVGALCVERVQNSDLRLGDVIKFQGTLIAVPNRS